MNETSLVDQFIIDTYTVELQDEIFRSFKIFESFNYSDYHNNILNILMADSYIDKSSISDVVLQSIINDLDYILNMHKVFLTSDATIEEKNNILTAFHLIQNLENYEPIITLLESDSDDIEKLSLILSELSNIEQSRILSIIDTFDNKILTKLKKYIYTIEDINKQPNNINEELKNNLKLFYLYCNKNNFNISQFDNILIGSSFKNYVNILDLDIILKDLDIKQKVYYILTLLYISSDGYLDPIKVYRENSESLFSDIKTISDIELAINKLITSYAEFKGAEIEKNRLSKTSH